MGRTRNYAVRVSVHDAQKGKVAVIVFSDEVMRMFPQNTSFVSLRRVEDRLAFVPHESRTERGAVVLKNNKLMVSTTSACAKALDFCGEYDDIVQAANGMLFVKLSQKRGYDTVLPTRFGDIHPNYDPGTEARAQDRASEATTQQKAVVAETATPVECTLVKVLASTIQNMRADKQRLETQIVEFEQKLESLREQYRRCDDAITTYQLALAVAKGEQ